MRFILKEKLDFTLAEGSTHVARKHNYRKIAFTLAEVLITLAIIGVVAALTIPPLIQGYKKSVVETRLAKFYSMMNQAIKMAEVDYGPQNTWTDYWEDSHGEPTLGDKYDEHINKYFAPYIKITGSEEVMDDILGYGIKVYYLADGSAFGFLLTENRDLRYYPFGNNIRKCNSKPNRIGSCLFPFAFIPYSPNGCSDFQNMCGNGLQTNLYKWDGNDDSLMNDTSYGCKNGTGQYCTAVIQRNGWKIPKDYPRKL